MVEKLSDNDILTARDALLLVDVQNDFLSGGRLAVRDGDAVIPPLNHCITLFRNKNLPVYASRDWHPANHCSFIAQRGAWPPHCIAGSHGARFAERLALPQDTIVVSKGNTSKRDSYSAFGGTSLHALLFATGIKRLFIGGLATDYCVLNTVLDALNLGYAVVLLTDAVRAVEALSGDGARALDRMKNCGAGFTTSLKLT